VASFVNPLKIAIVAGETSGDLLGGDLLKAFRAKYPDAEFMGIAGPLMKSQNCLSLYPIEELSVIGIWAILKRLPRLLKLRKKLANQIIAWQPDLFIGVDAPEFNLGLELRLKKAGIKTAHYVSPSVWAWREKRIIKIKAAVDYMLTLFPFEETIYKKHQIPVACVGHPLATMIAMKPDVSAAREALGIPIDAKVLAVLPGSRGSELKYLSSTFIEVAARLKALYVAQEDQQLEVIVPLINEKRRQQFTDALNEFDPELSITLIDGRSREVMCAADTVLLASGTATLEALLLKKPMVVAYKVSALSMAIYSKLLKIKQYSLPNLLSDKPYVPELIQEQATVDLITDAVILQLKQGLTDEQANEYQKIHQTLQLGGGEYAVTELVKHFNFS
jgi:lipid-A-disaccharide synthase